VIESCNRRVIESCNRRVRESCGGDFSGGL
jgi:hypothetical protein